MPGPTRRLIFALLTLLVASVCAAARHPANIPIARSRVAPNGKIDFELRFDVLAFVLDELPTVVLDPPMNALLDGPTDVLAARLEEAKKRFQDGFTITADHESGSIDHLDFPTVADVLRWLKDGATPRLPVMITLSLTAHLPKGATHITYKFPEALGTVVLTTEFPYQEPISEPVEPGDTSQTLTIPTEADVAAREKSMLGHPGRTPAKKSTSQPEQAARAAIQHQYNAWSHAYMANDVKTLLGILAPEYTLKTAKGALIRYSEYAVMLNLRKKKHSDTSRYQTEILRMTLHENTAAIFSRETTTDSELNPKTDQRVTSSFQHDYIDVWLLRKGKWQLQSTVTQREQSLTPNAKPPK